MAPSVSEQATINSTGTPEILLAAVYSAAYFVAVATVRGENWSGEITSSVLQLDALLGYAPKDTIERIVELAQDHATFSWSIPILTLPAFLRTLIRIREYQPITSRWVMSKVLEIASHP
jgi:hypothetical protein